MRGGELRQPKLTLQIRVEVKKMVAIGFTPPLIKQILKDDYDIDISTQAIWQHYIKNPKAQKDIEAVREKMTTEILKIPIAHKVTRLKYLERAMNECLQWHVSSRTTNKAGNIIEQIDKIQPAAIAALVREARVETEGDVSDEDKTTMLDIIRNFSKRGQTKDDDTGPTDDGKLDPNLPDEPDTMGTLGSGPINIL